MILIHRIIRFIKDTEIESGEMLANETVYFTYKMMTGSKMLYHDNILHSNSYSYRPLNHDLNLLG